MQAIVQERFGPPDVLALMDIDRPEVRPDEVLIKVRAASLNPYDWHMLRGDPRIARLMGSVGLTKPKTRVAGIDVAGRVEAVGANVHDLKPGDDVFGFCVGSCAEYATADIASVVRKPADLSYVQAAAIPMGAVTALHAIRDVGRVSSGQRVLVNGAAGGVGIYAVQIAASLGAEVTGVCSGRNLDLVRSIGATHVVDYQTEDFTDRVAEYDVILDNVGNRPLSRLRRTVTPSGTVVLNGGGSPGRIIGAVGSILRAAVVNVFVRQKITFVPTTRSLDDLLTVVAMIESGELRPVIDRAFPLAETAEGLRYLEQGHTSGKVVITVE
jgi:NADPH:quinone reductase-like Zn-dependent oxidoreductase